MGSWSTFRRIRIGVFVLITVISLLLTIVYSLFLSKDFHHYNKLQRAIVAASAVINGITAILMYLMLAVRYSIKLDAIRIIMLLGMQAGSTALFTLHNADLPCNAFKAGATCRQISSYTAIASWVLCGLLVVYAACLAIMACVPRPPPIEGLEPELDAEVPVNMQARSVARLSIDSHTRLVNSDAEKQLYSARPLPDTHIRQQMQREAQQSAWSQYRSNASPPNMMGRDENVLYRPAGVSRRMRSLDESRPLPPSGSYADPIPRAWTQTPDSMYSISTSSSSSVVFASGPRSATLPPPAQFNPAQRPGARRTRSSSLSNSVHSLTSRESMELPPPPVPSMGVRRMTPGQQSIRSLASSDSSGTGHWRQLVLDAAAGPEGSI